MYQVSLFSQLVSYSIHNQFTIQSAMDELEDIKVKHYILEANMSKDLKWGKHLKTGEQAISPGIIGKVGVLILVTKY